MTEQRSNLVVSGLRAIVPTRILRRWDLLAAAQLCEAAPRLAQELDEERAQRWHAEGSADFWAEQAQEMQLELCDRVGGTAGITPSCRLVVVTQ